MKLNKIFLGLIPLAMGILGSCRDSVSEQPDSENVTSLDYISASFATRDDGDQSGEDGEGSGNDSNTVYDPVLDEHDDTEEANGLFDDGFNEGDALYFSQLVSGILVPFQGISSDNYPQGLSEAFKQRYPENYNNLYTYYYHDRYPTSWEDQPAGLGGYNFFPLSGGKMEWEDVQAWGYDNNGYALFALYNPVENELNMNFQVAVDQTSLENLRNSNFIGAYHSSSSPGRIRFKLYHLMCYFKLTLYIPVFNDNDTDKNGNKIRSGYPADALQSVQLLDARTAFNINWYANRSSDDAPACAAVANQERSNISMFIPELNNVYYPDTDGLPPMVTLKTSSFFRPEDQNYDPNGTDLCWKITVSALLPAGQNFASDDPNYPGLIWTDKNFIRINMRQNIGEVPKSFVFNGNPDPVQGGHLTNNSNLTIEQGGVQHLSLYIPRHGAAAVLIGATVNDWKYAKNDKWGLNMEPPEDEDQQ